jgi:hypothetical protein
MLPRSNSNLKSSTFISNNTNYFLILLGMLSVRECRPHLQRVEFGQIVVSNNLLFLNNSFPTLYGSV